MPTRRHGLATLELALVLPLLVFMGAAIFQVGTFWMRKSATAVTARRQAWQAQGSGGESWAPAGHQTAGQLLLGRASSGLSQSSAERPMSLPPLGRGRLTISSQHAVLTDPWAHQSLPLEPIGQLRAHPAALRLGGADVARFLDVFDVRSLPLDASTFLGAAASAASAAGGPFSDLLRNGLNLEQELKNLLSLNIFERLGKIFRIDELKKIIEGIKKITEMKDLIEDLLNLMRGGGDVDP